MHGSRTSATMKLPDITWFASSSEQMQESNWNRSDLKFVAMLLCGDTIYEIPPLDPHASHLQPSKDSRAPATIACSPPGSVYNRTAGGSSDGQTASADENSAQENDSTDNTGSDHSIIILVNGSDSERYFELPASPHPWVFELSTSKPDAAPAEADTLVSSDGQSVSVYTTGPHQ